MLSETEMTERQRLLHELAEHRALMAQIKFKLTQTYLRASHYEESLEFSENEVMRLQKELGKLGKPDVLDRVMLWIRK